MMIFHDAPQGSQEWLNARSVCVTASEMKCVMAKGRGNAPSITRQKYMLSLANSIITGIAPPQGYYSDAMAVGNEREEESRKYFSMVSGKKIETVGFAYMNELKRIGASFDGLVEDGDGVFEAKNPELSTHLLWLLNGGLPPEHKTQVQSQLWVSDRKYCDFISYNPDAFQMLFHVRVERDEDFIKQIAAETYKFIGELDVMVEKFRAIQQAE